MNIRSTTRGLVFAATACLLSVGFSTSAQACDSYHTPRPTVHHYETHTTWVTEQVPYWATVVKYKPCGTRYYQKVIRYKTVKVQVTKRVPVYYRYP